MRTPGPVLRKAVGPTFPIQLPLSGGLCVTFDELTESLARLLLVENTQVVRHRVGPRTGFGPVHVTVAAWLTDLRRAFRLSHTAVCLAMAYFDRVTWSMSFQVTELEAIIASCVLIAFKYNDPDPETPSRLTLNLLSDCCEGNVTPAGIMQQEVAVLTRGLQWELNQLTHMNFLDVLLALQTDNDEGDAVWQKRISTVAHDLALRVMTEEQFWHLRPSSLATVIVIAARHIAALASGLYPLVPALHAVLSKLLGVDMTEIGPLVDRLVQMYDISLPPLTSPRVVSGLS